MHRVLLWSLRRRTLGWSRLRSSSAGGVGKFSIRLIEPLLQLARVRLGHLDLVVLGQQALLVLLHAPGNFR